MRDVKPFFVLKVKRNLRFLWQKVIRNLQFWMQRQKSRQPFFVPRHRRKLQSRRQKVRQLRFLRFSRQMQTVFLC